MPNPLEVTIKEIQDLSEDPARAQIRSVLFQYALEKGIPARAITISDNKNAADGGLDGRITWHGDPTVGVDDFIPPSPSGWQFKATSMGPKDCLEELFEVDGTTLKPGVKEMLETGTYVLFCTKDDLTDRQLKAREKKMRGGLPAEYRSANIRIYDAKTLCKFTNRYPSCSASVKAILGKPTSGFQSITEMLKKFPTALVTDKKRQDIIAELRSVTEGAQRVRRVVGLPTIGKTRIVLEAMKKNSNDTKESPQNANAVYIDLEEDRRINISEIVRLWINERLPGTVIVDNCDEQLHESLKKEIEGAASTLSLITIGDDEEAEGKILIEQLHENTSITIAQSIIPQGTSEMIYRQIARVADGFPALVEAFSIEYNRNPGGELSDLKDVVFKKIFGESNWTDSEVMKAARFLAAFDQIQIYGKNCEAEIMLKQFEYGMDITSFRAAIRKLGKRVVHRGGYARLIPPPLAAKLAKQFYELVGSDKVASIFADVESLARAKASMSLRLTNLGLFDEGNDIVASLTETDRPFGNAEVLLTDMGSRLFCSFVEVNPSACLAALKRVLENVSAQELRQRYRSVYFLVEAIKKLCVHEKYFFDATPLLLYFARAEDSGWNNGAKRHFFGLFHIFLSGTSVPLLKRLSIFDEIQSRPVPEDQPLIIEALGEALNNSHFVGTADIQAQSGKFAIPDYVPKDYGEVRDYFREVIKRLMKYVSPENPFCEYARHELASHFRDIYRLGMLAEIAIIVRQNIALLGSFWPEASGKVQDILNFDITKINPEDKTTLQQLQVELIPSDLPERISIFVTESPWWDPNPTIIGDEVEDSGDRKATEFAHEVVRRYPDFIKELPRVFTNRQARGYTFGKALGTLVEDRQNFIDESLRIISTIPKDTLDLSVLSGFLRSVQNIDPSLVTSLLENLFASGSLVQHLLPLTASIKMDQGDLERLLAAVKSGKIEPKEFNQLSYGSVLSHLPPPVVVNFIHEFWTENENALPIAFSILFMYCLHDEKKNNDCKVEFISMLSTTGILNNDYGDRSRLAYYVEEKSKELLTQQKLNAVAENLVNELIALSHSHRRILLDYAEHSLLLLLLKDYQTISWALLSKAIVGNYSLFSFLTDSDDDDEKYGVLFDLPSAALIDWAKASPQEVRWWLAGALPLVKRTDNTIEIHPFAKEFILTFADEDGIKDELSRNIYSFGWTGSPIPKYITRQQILAQLTAYPKIAQWAREQLEYIEIALKQEKERNARESIGVHGL